jgi:hypothetical protein
LDQGTTACPKQDSGLKPEAKKTARIRHNEARYDQHCSPHSIHRRHTGFSYHLDFVTAILRWKQKPAVDSVLLTYRVFPFKLNPVAQHLNYDSVSKIPFVIPLSSALNQYGSSKGMFDFGNLSTVGSFGRQISFGNSQDAVLNSTLNLQMQGMLGDSIEIHAAITDNNIPIQPTATHSS